MISFQAIHLWVLCNHSGSLIKVVTAQEYGGSLQGLQPAVHVHDIRNENKEIATLTGTSIGKT